tara:strand:- start:404 stop:1450 length:1047 start_codon:yes stop_codon:yes gene_type:complete
MVNIDDVYQKVLALANKEQRGYITPQEFNLMADRAQKEIYNSYFHDYKTGFFKPKAEAESFDDLEMTQQKLDYCREQSWVKTEVITTSDYRVIVTFTMPSTTYKVANVFLKTAYHQLKYNYDTNDADSLFLEPYTIGNDNQQYKEIKRVERNDLLNILSNPLTKPTLDRPIYVSRKSGGGRIYEVYPMASYKRAEESNYQVVPANDAPNIETGNFAFPLDGPVTLPDGETNPAYLPPNPMNGIGGEHNYNQPVFPSLASPIDNLYKIKGAEILVDYWKVLAEPKWGYVVVKQKALYNSNNTTHFSLHPSEEENLVIKILQLAGITIEKPQLTKMAMGMEAKNKQEQND